MPSSAEKTASELSDIERRTLAALSTDTARTPDDIAQKSGLPIDSVRRAISWLSEKKLVQVQTQATTRWTPTAAGSSSISNGLPEKLFIEALDALGGKATLEQVFRKSQLNRPEFNAAMGLAKKNAWIGIQKTADEMVLELTGLEKDLREGRYPLERWLSKLKDNNAHDAPPAVLAELKKRGLAVDETRNALSARLSVAGKDLLPLLKTATARAYDVAGVVPPLFIGKKQPYRAFLTQVSDHLVRMGFREMESPLLTQEFYNFDVLFQPQNHPARTWTDTYQLAHPKTGKLPSAKIVSAVKASHEHGGDTGSRGWGYDWKPEIAARLMPAAHATAHSGRQLVKGAQVPGKYYSISRCFRPDVVDATHLVEFNQLDGIILAEQLNFPQLLGQLKEFAVEFAGTDRVRFAPSYYPFTEPSVQLNAYHPKLGWMELGGAGIFRPELTKPLGVTCPVLAWGIGIDRLAMLKLQSTDIRNLFSDDLRWLREHAGVRME
jgi:phenylalanyl-tRNA synthetase alpha chain